MTHFESALLTFGQRTSIGLIVPQDWKRQQEMQNDAHAITLQ
jgi:hypothetical protein